MSQVIGLHFETVSQALGKKSGKLQTKKTLLSHWESVIYKTQSMIVPFHIGLHLMQTRLHKLLQHWILCTNSHAYGQICTALYLIMHDVWETRGAENRSRLIAASAQRRAQWNPFSLLSLLSTSLDILKARPTIGSVSKKYPSNGKEITTYTKALLLSFRRAWVPPERERLVRKRRRAEKKL